MAAPPPRKPPHFIPSVQGLSPVSTPFGSARSTKSQSRLSSAASSHHHHHHKPIVGSLFAPQQATTSTTAAVAAPSVGLGPRAPSALRPVAVRPRSGSVPLPPQSLQTSSSTSPLSHSPPDALHSTVEAASDAPDTVVSDPEPSMSPEPESVATAAVVEVTDAQLPPLPVRPMASPLDLLGQSLQVLSEIKQLVAPLPASFMPDEVNVAIFGECPGLVEMFEKMGMKAARISEPEAASKIRNAKPPFHLVVVDCVPGKTAPAGFVTAVLNNPAPPPIILAQALGKMQGRQAQSCIQAGAQYVITTPTTPEVLRSVCTEALKSQHVSHTLQQNVVAHAQLLTHLSKILMEQDLYLRSLSEHLSLLEKYKKQSERLIATLQQEVESLHRVNQANQQRGERLARENVTMKWKHAFDVASRLRRPKQATAALESATKEVSHALTSGTSSQRDAVARVAATMVTSSEEAPTPLSDVGVQDGVFLGPLQMITHIVRRLARIDQFLDKEDLKNVLLSVVKALADKDWYVPKMENLDGQTQMWVDSTFRNICPDVATHSTGETSTRASSAGAGSDHPGSETAVVEQKHAIDVGIEATLFSEVLAAVDKDSLLDWGFSAVKLNHEQLSKAVVVMFNDLGLFTEFKISISNFIQFLGILEANYRENPYHSFIHACDVAQVCYLFLKTTKLGDSLQPIDSLALMIGALCHDLDHPGLNNVFQINARTPLALLYNDSSVLENHHASLSVRLLGSEDVTVLSNLTPVQAQEFRRSLISEILATDMVKHFELVSRFQSHVETSPFSKDKKEDRQLLLDIVLHSADISNLTRPQELSLVWSNMLLDEYLRQGDEEKAAGLPVSPYMDRNDTDQVKMSINFITFIGLPLFNALAKAFPEIQCCIEKLHENKKWWEDRRAASAPVAPK